jgi:hypothetical protein
MTKRPSTKPKASTQPISKDALAEELRVKIPQLEGLKTHNKEIMLLVGRILNPSNVEDAACSLILLSDSLYNAKEIGDRAELCLYAEFYALLFTDDWDKNLRKIIKETKFGRDHFV